MRWILVNKTWMNGTSVDLSLALLETTMFRLVLMGRWHPRHEDEKVLLQLNGLQAGYLSYTSAEGTFSALITDFIHGLRVGRCAGVSRVSTGFSLGRVGVHEHGDFFADYRIGALAGDARAAGTPSMQSYLGYGHALFSPDTHTLIRSTAYGQSPTPPTLLPLAYLTLVCNYGGTFVGQVNLYREDPFFPAETYYYA